MWIYRRAECLRVACSPVYVSKNPNLEVWVFRSVKQKVILCCLTVGPAFSACEPVCLFSNVVKNRLTSCDGLSNPKIKALDRIDHDYEPRFRIADTTFLQDQANVERNLTGRFRTEGLGLKTQLLIHWSFQGQPCGIMILASRGCELVKTTSNSLGVRPPKHAMNLRSIATTCAWPRLQCSRILRSNRTCDGTGIENAKGALRNFEWSDMIDGLVSPCSIGLHSKPKLANEKYLAPAIRENHCWSLFLSFPEIAHREFQRRVIGSCPWLDMRSFNFDCGSSPELIHNTHGMYAKPPAEDDNVTPTIDQRGEQHALITCSAGSCIPMLEKLTQGWCPLGNASCDELSGIFGCWLSVAPSASFWCQGSCVFED